MAKRAKKQTEAERAVIDAERIAAAEKTGSYGENVVEFVPDPVLGVAHTEPSAALVGMYEKELGEEIDEDAEVEAIAELADAEDEVKEPNSIVKDKFKVKYIENAIATGATHKAAKRSNWDWLAQTLAAACLSEGGKLEIGAFTDILDANGVDHSRWTNKNRGWEGRFRMTGRVALQKVVANAGVLKTPAGSEIEAPAEWRTRYQTKA
jgi:hypothetical protein